MDDDSEGLQRIKEDFESFRKRSEECRSAGDFIRADWQDAYARAARVRDRFLKEQRNRTLTRSEHETLSKVFEKDVFTEGAMNVRHVGEHAEKRTEFTIRTVDNVPIPLPAETSAMQMFAGPIVFLTDVHGVEHRFDHGKTLIELEYRIGNAINNVD